MKYLSKFDKIIKTKDSYEFLYENVNYDLNKMIDEAYKSLKGKKMSSKEIFEYIIDNLTDGELPENVYNELYKKVTGCDINVEFDDVPMYVK